VADLILRASRIDQAGKKTGQNIIISAGRLPDKLKPDHVLAAEASARKFL
jgi:hypothetical protein